MRKVLISKKPQTIVGFVVSPEDLKEICKEIGADRYSVTYDLNDVVTGVEFEFPNMSPVPAQVGDYIYLDGGSTHPRRFIHRISAELDSDIFDFTIVPDE